MIEVGFVAIVAAVAGYVVAVAASAGRRAGRGARPAAIVALALAAWLTVTAVIASGALGFDSRPPRLFALPWVMLLTSVAVTRTTTARELIAHTPPALVIAIDVFRVGVELVLWRLCVADLLPIELTFEGRNFDILAGATAIPVAVLAARLPRLAVAWHVLGLALLINVVARAVRSGPLVLGGFPFVWLPAFLVPVAALSHIVGLRQAFAKPPRIWTHARA